MRREDRVPTRIGTTVTFLTQDGQVLIQRATTVDISDQGGCLEGLRSLPMIGEIVAVQNGHKRARFRVVWTGERGTRREGQLGVERIEGAAESTPILYIDDDMLAAEERTSRLNALGYHVTFAASPIEGFEKLQTSQFSLVIAAYPLRDIDTTELLVAIRRSGSKAKLMLLSGYGRLPDALLELVDAPAMKTDPLPSLVNAIERVLEDQKHIKFPTRSYRRYAVKVPFAVEVLRAGEKEMLYGTTADLNERGIGAVVRGTLVPGEMVRVYFSLPNSPSEIDARAIVRHRCDSGDFGFEFISVSPQTVQTIKTLCAVLPAIGSAKAAAR